MALLLRQTRIVKLFSRLNFHRNFHLISRTQNSNFLHSNRLLTHTTAKCLASQVSNPQNTHDVLDRSLRRLDEDVRRIGRISRKEIEDVLEELRQLGSATSSQSLLIIRCCGNLVPEELPEVRTKLVREIWSTLEKLGVPMDISHYNALLRVYLENEYSFSPTEFLADLERKGIEPNRVTYQRLIARYCQEGDIEGATRILEFMREKQLPVNENVFNALMMGHFQKGDVEGAAGMLAVMQQAGLEPSSDTYTTLLCGYAKKGDFTSLKSTLEECDKKDIYLLDKDLMDILYELAVNGHHQYIDTIIERMKHHVGYNQDAINTILRLINAGQDDAALKLLYTMPRSSRPDGQLSPVGNFFIKQLIKANRPTDKVISLCTELEEKELNPRALLHATEVSLQLGNTELAAKLLITLKKDGFPIRQHYFWPLMVTNGKKHDIQGVLDVVKVMREQFNLPVWAETLRDYVIPPLAEVCSPNEIILKLRSADVSATSVAVGLVSYLLLENKLSEAAQVASWYKVYYTPTFLVKPLVTAYQNTGDTDSFISMLRCIHNGLEKAKVSAEEDSTSVPDFIEIIGNILMDLMSVFSKTDKISKMESLLKALVDEGFSISNTTAERIQDKFGSELTSELSNLLAKLSSGELVLASKSTRVNVPQPLDEFRLKSMINSATEKGDNAYNAKRLLLGLYCKNKDLEQAETLLKEFDASGFVYPPGVLAQVIEMYCNLEKFPEAKAYYERLIEKDPDFQLNSIKVIKLATLFLKNGCIDDAVNLLQNQARETVPEDENFGFRSLCWNFLNQTAEEGNVELTKLLFNSLINNKFVSVSNSLLGPIIKSYIVKNDITGAMNEFEECCRNYKMTPWKGELACRFIQAEDATSLQRLTDLSTEVHGEINSLYDLVFAFLDCGRIRQARRILETPGLQVRTQRLISACERYRQVGQTSSLEGLIEASRDLSYIDRSNICYQLLLSYCKSDDVEKASGLWTKMQEEDIQPSEQFLITLAELLEKHGHTVPFIIPQKPEKSEAPEVTKKVANIEQSKTNGKKSLDHRIQLAVTNNNIDEAIKLAESTVNLNSEKVSTQTLCKVIERLVKDGRRQEAVRLMCQMFDMSMQPTYRILRYTLNQLSENGDIANIESIGTYLNSEQKKEVMFGNKLCTAYVNAGKANEYLDRLEKDLHAAETVESKAQVGQKFPKGPTIKILEKHPELLPKYESLCHTYASQGILSPFNMLWQHYMINKDLTKENQIWSEFLKNEKSLFFRWISDVFYATGDEEISTRLITRLKEGNVESSAIGSVYSTLIDYHTNRDNVEKALEALEESLKDVSLEDLRTSTLQRLQSLAVKSGKQFVYSIPQKASKPSSSDSSSEDDEPSKVHIAENK